MFITFYDASILGFKSDIDGEHYSFLRILIFGVVNCIIGASLLASIEVLYLSKILRKKPFGIALLIKTAFYIMFMLFFISLGKIYIYSSEINKPIFSREVLDLYITSLYNAKLLMAVVFWGIACMLALFILQVSDKFGQGVLLNFLLGKYHQPKEEERIFMFLDLNSATTIAEKLGPHNYSSFLKDFFFDLDDAIYETKGAVFQFIGDEVVIIWNIQKGIEDDNCIRFFFLAEEKIEASKNKYIERFGVCPEFKAGLHCGKVIVTEVGGSKSEIAYHGDTINTAARIRSTCHDYNKKLLISENLLNYFPSLDEKYKIESHGVSQLKGKENVIALFSIELE
ncbi:adenylate/guanylate cyclase domain-containing protein [Bacteroidota bacterium]